MEKKNKKTNKFKTSKQFAQMWAEFLDLFFSDSRGYEITVFTWTDTAETRKKNIKVGFNFTWKIIEKNKIITGCSGDFLFPKQAFSQEFAGCNTQHDLSEKLSQILQSGEFEKSSTGNLYNVHQGLNFNQTNWKDTFSSIFGSQAIKEIETKKIYEKLNKELTKKTLIENKHKI